VVFDAGSRSFCTILPNFQGYLSTFHHVRRKHSFIVLFNVCRISHGAIQDFHGLIERV